MANATFEVFREAVWEGHPGSATSLHAQTRAQAQATFLKGMLEIPSQHGRRNPLDWAVSLIAHIIIVAAVVLAPFFFTQVLDLRSFQTTFLVAPAPPAAPPPPAAQMQKLTRPLPRVLLTSHLTAPTVIPARIQIVHDEAPPDVGAGGVIGGIPGGQTGGVLGGIIGGMADARAAIPPPPPSRKIVRVGGDVKQPQPISTPPPAYPAVARAAKIEGVVIIDAVIDEQGNVVRARAIEGPGLLVAAALTAVTQWKYQPTYLDGQAVEIQTHVEVHFRLQ
ncbi:MAG: energy transducer TonB [Candidatus Acidiferrales bacterium]|jgi:protein TonB